MGFTYIQGYIGKKKKIKKITRKQKENMYFIK
jgi:hypothetical protein